MGQNSAGLPLLNPQTGLRHGGRSIMVHAVYFDEDEFTIAPEQREKRFEIGKNICYQTRENVSTEFNIEVES
jgi:hypothetical protein